MIGAQQNSLTEPLKLHIGCGNQRLEGYINCDLHHTSATDQLFDCTEIWPFPWDCVSTIYCSHTLEHLENYRGFFREAHRVLRPDGNLQIRVPYGGHKAAHWDLTHVRPWFGESFCFLQPGYSLAVGNAQHRDWLSYFSVEDVVLRVSAKFIPILRWRLARRILLYWLEHLQDSIEEMWVMLVPLKTDQQIADWTAIHPGNAVPARYCIYRHHLERRPLRAYEIAEFVNLRQETHWNGFHNWMSLK